MYKYFDSNVLLIPYEYIRYYLINNFKFKYESYNYKDAIEELKQTTLTNSLTTNTNNTNNDIFLPYWGSIPNEIKDNHIVWRTGKVREIKFNPDGTIKNVKIGNKYNKTFFLWDFGVNVKPIIFKSDDTENLINRGLAIEDEL